MTFNLQSLIDMPLATRDAIDYAERVLRSMPQVEMPVKHYFGDGVYAREIFIPKNTILTGRIHKFNDLNIVHYGDIDVLSTNGFKRVGPCTFTGKAGTKQIGYAYEDTLWTTFHATTETDLAVLDRILFEDDGSESMFDWATGKVKEDPIQRDRQDFLAMLDKYGIPEEVVYRESRDKRNIVHLDMAALDVEIKRSLIQGRGVFCKRDLLGNSCVGAARINGRRTQLGRLTNHSKYPNCTLFVDASGDIGLGTLRTILAGEELTVDYRQSLSLAGVRKRGVQ